jgi:ABC-type antimicrobial peptide transport system permease subunit
VAGVLAFSVSGRTREFGIRLAVGSQPQRILLGVLKEGVTIAAAGVAIGGAGGFVLGRVLAGYVQQVQLPSVVTAIGAASVLVLAAVIASVAPAARAARVDVMRALRSD